MAGALLTVGDVARRSGVAVSALHFYERQRLISSTRTAGNQRRYARDVLRRLAVIQVAQRAGVPLREIADAFAMLPEGRAPSRRDWSHLSARWRASLDARIAGLTALRDQLDTCIGCGCLSIRRCGLYNPGDVQAGEGTGSRLLRIDAGATTRARGRERGGESERWGER